MAGNWDLNIECEPRASSFLREGGSGNDIGFDKKEKGIPRTNGIRDKGTRGEFRMYGGESQSQVSKLHPWPYVSGLATPPRFEPRFYH